jgi:hypothetical protein
MVIVYMYGGEGRCLPIASFVRIYHSVDGKAFSRAHTHNVEYEWAFKPSSTMPTSVPLAMEAFTISLS